MTNYVINKADFLAAEPWDMRLGPAIWGKFTDAIPAEDFDLKHQVYCELAALPANEFHKQMKEIMAGTKRGQKVIQEILNGVKRELQEDEFNKALNELSMGDDWENNYLDEDYL
jgi:hypothetical protein